MTKLQCNLIISCLILIVIGLFYIGYALSRNGAYQLNVDSRGSNTVIDTRTGKVWEVVGSKYINESRSAPPEE